MKSNSTSDTVVGDDPSESESNEFIQRGPGGTQVHTSRYDQRKRNRRAGVDKSTESKAVEISTDQQKYRALFWPIFFAMGLLIGAAIAITWALERDSPIDPSAAIPSQYEADRAMGYLRQICDFGPRPSGSDAMNEQQTFLTEFFEKQGASVQLQTFEVRDPESGLPVRLSNVIASWGADRPLRFLACAHYDTRPFPDRDRKNPKGTFVGANDGASGVAALMEWSHQFQTLPKHIGIDVVLFDGEELVYSDRRGDDYFLGSTYFAQNYADNPPAIPYRAGILLDMVGDKELRLYHEANSLKYAPKLTRQIWAVAKRIGVREFVNRRKHNVRDDHLPLNQIARIPTTDIIDFDYPRPGIGQPSYWHTQQDIPENCSGKSLVSVVYVIDNWLRRQRK